ncbi:MAG: DUF6047 family protein [Bacteroides stercoris]
MGTRIIQVLRRVKGCLLFGRDYVGNRQYGDFMATNIEKRFFEPDFEEKYLNVYELRGWHFIDGRESKPLLR